MAKRVYFAGVKEWFYQRWKEVTGAAAVVGVSIGMVFFYLASIGAITITGHSGDVACAGTIADPCVAYINLTANEDIFLYPTDYDPYGRNTPYEFYPEVKEWHLYRSWGTGWREIPLDTNCKGTWCGAPDSSGDTKYSFAFRKGRTYQMKIEAFKNYPSETIKWGFFLENAEIDPLFLPPYSLPTSITDSMTIYLPFNDTSYNSGGNYPNLGTGGGVFYMDTLNDVVEFEGDYWLNITDDPGCCSDGLMSLNSNDYFFSATGQSASICYTIYPKSIQGGVDNYIFRSQQTYNAMTSLITSTGMLRFTLDDNADAGTFNMTSRIGMELHVCGVFNNSADTVKLYVNGTLFSTNTGKTNDYGGTNSTVLLGHRDYNDNKWPDVYLKDLRVFNKALNVSEVGWIYNQDFGVTMTDELIECWDFEGDADGWTGNHDGIVTDAIQSTGKVGSNAYYFDGAGDHITITNDADFIFNGDNYAYCLWAKQDTPQATAFPSMIGKGDTGAGEWMLRLTASTNQTSVYGDGGNLNVNHQTNINDEDWHYYCVVRKSATETRIWIDGVEGSSVDNSDYTLNDATSIFIGGADNDAARWWKGDIDEVVMYNRSLLQDEIDALYNGGAGLSCAALSPVDESNITLIVGDASTLTTNEQNYIAYIQNNSYYNFSSVAIADDDWYNLTTLYNPLAYVISDSILSGTLSTKLRDTEKGVMNTYYGMLDAELGICTTTGTSILQTINLTDNSEPFDWTTVDLHDYATSSSTEYDRCMSYSWCSDCVVHGTQPTYPDRAAYITLETGGNRTNSLGASPGRRSLHGPSISATNSVNLWTDWQNQSTIELLYWTAGITEGAADTCTYSSSNWEVDCSDLCYITTNVDVDGILNITGSGTFNITSGYYVNATGDCAVDSTCDLIVGGDLLCT